MADCGRRVTCADRRGARLAGTSFPIDRRCVAPRAGIRRASRELADAVSDRDFAIEFASGAASSGAPVAPGRGLIL